MSAVALASASGSSVLVTTVTLATTGPSLDIETHFLTTRDLACDRCDLVPELGNGEGFQSQSHGSGVGEIGQGVSGGLGIGKAMQADRDRGGAVR